MPRQCQHNVNYYYCTECPGPGICEHGRRRQTCKDCGGKSICEHGRERHRCKDCGGKSICEHGRRRQTCKDCGGKSICEHGRQRHQCKDCGGKSICEHGRQRHQCKDCGGKGICEHGRQRHRCKDCGGKGICEHGRQRHRCKDCGGKSICEHGRRRQTCVTCTPDKGCQYCHAVYVDSRSRYKPHCARCYYYLHPDEKMPNRYKIREDYLVKFIQESYPDEKIDQDRRIAGGCSNKRPDVLIDKFTHVIIVECDENQHKSYSCENKRSMELFRDLGNRPIVFIRFNPDGYIRQGLKISGCFRKTKTGVLQCINSEWRRRTAILKDTIDLYMGDVPDREFTEEKLFYDQIDPNNGNKEDKEEKTSEEPSTTQSDDESADEKTDEE